MHEARIKICFIHKYIQLSYNQIYLTNYKNKNLLKNSLTTDHHARNYIIKKSNLLRSFPQLRANSLYPRNKPKAPQLFPTYKMHKVKRDLLTKSSSFLDYCNNGCTSKPNRVKEFAVQVALLSEMEKSSTL